MQGDYGPAKGRMPVRRIKLAAGGIGAALILVAALAVLHGGALPAPLAQALAAYRDGRFAVAVRERSAAADEARAREDLVRLLVEVRNDLGSPAAIPIDRGAAWRRRLHRDALALADAWAGPAQCVTGGGCTARPADAEACIELSSQLVRIGEAAAVLGALERLLWSGLGGRGLEVPDVRPINTVLDQGCSPVAAIAAGMASAQRAAGAEHDAAASSTWERIKAMPSQEAVQRYAAV